MNNFIKTDLKEWFNISLSQDSKSFIGTFQKIELPEEIKGDKEEIKIEVGTVHSAKGQTHCATLYIETFYIGYEIGKIKSINPFVKAPHTCAGIRDKESFKMLYVGFSRPTHLLCFAVLEENVKNDLEKFSSAGWKIETL